MTKKTVTPYAITGTWNTTTALGDGVVNGDIVVLTTAAATASVVAGTLVNPSSFPVQTGVANTFAMQVNSTLVLSLQSATADTWEILSYTDPSTYADRFFTIATDLTISAAITAGGFIDQVGAQYTIQNTDTAARTLTTTTIGNYLSFPNNCAATTSLLLNPNQSATIITKTVGTEYEIVAISASQPNGTFLTGTIPAGASMSTIFTSAGIVEQTGASITIYNNISSTYSILNGGVAWFNANSYAPLAYSGAALKIPPLGSATIAVITPGSSYFIQSLDANYDKSFTISTDRTLTNLIVGQGLIVGQTIVVTNTDSTNGGNAHTLTAVSFSNGATYPIQYTEVTGADTFTLPFNGTVALQLESVAGATGNGTWAIVSYNEPAQAGTVAFSAKGPSPSVTVGTVSTYPASKIILPNIVGGAASGNPQNYYNTTTGRFTPLTAGFYQVNAFLYNDGAYDYLWLQLFKNGIPLQENAANNERGFGSGIQIAVVVYMNGSTDYLELGAYYGPNSGTPVQAPTYTTSTLFNAYLTNQTQTLVVGTTAAGSVGKTTNQSIASATPTKVVLEAVSEDPQSWWNAANNRWIPTIPGYYQVDASVTYSGVGTSSLYEGQILKNGGIVSNGLFQLNQGVSGFQTCVASRVVYMNGSTDYLEMWTYQPSGVSQSVTGSATRTNFSISLVGANQAIDYVRQTTSAYGIGSYPGNVNTPYAVAQLDNIKIWQQGINNASFYFGTVTGSTQLQGSGYYLAYGGGGGSFAMTNTTGSGPLTVTTAGVTNVSSNAMSTWTYTFRDLTANISYRATFILQHGYTNSQCFLERMGGQQI
jgi:hypothetical protein